ncbi:MULTISPECIES: hypothetical protein [unclassified Phaeobacter]|uniref:hypothetical protein n=1 Tax=unclassified Phaeobacter TaxID=2621772 RepID=UPI003A84F10B
MMTWAKMPSAWIEEGRLGEISWKDYGTEGIMALRAYIVIAQRIEAGNSTGTIKATYDELCQAAHLSRTSLSKGLRRLQELDLLQCHSGGKRSHYKLVDFNAEKGWAKLPAQSLYDGYGEIRAFRTWSCRSYAELDALKAYLLIVSRRDRDTNASHITHKQFNSYAKIPKARIRGAISMLVEWGLIYADQQKRDYPEPGFTVSYRLFGLYPYRHNGTVGRNEMQEQQYGGFMDAT